MNMAYKPPQSEVKLVKCKNCGADVTVNSAYPIDYVETCKHCPDKK